MAVTQSTVTANIGHPSSLTIESMFTSSRARPIHPRFADRFEVPRGTTSLRIPRYGAPPAAAARLEAAAVVVPTTLATITQATATLAKYGLAMGLTDEAVQRAIPENDPRMIVEEDILFAQEEYLAADAIVGMSVLFTTAGTINGTAGADLVLDTLRSSCRTVWDTVGDNVILVGIIEGVGFGDIDRERRASASAALAGESLQAETRQMLTEALFVDSLEGAGYAGTYFQQRLHLFVEPRPAILQTITANKIGAIFVPAVAGLNGFGSQSQGGRKVRPAYAIAYDPDPAVVSQQVHLNVRRFEMESGAHILMDRAGDGQFQLITESVSRGTVVEAHSTGTAGVRYGST